VIVTFKKVVREIMHSRETFKGNPKGMRKYTTEGTRIKRL
jgi:hypothetical protein